jgi:hypothetical protein
VAPLSTLGWLPPEESEDQLLRGRVGPCLGSHIAVPDGGMLVAGSSRGPCPYRASLWRLGGASLVNGGDQGGVYSIGSSGCGLWEPAMAHPARPGRPAGEGLEVVPPSSEGSLEGLLGIFSSGMGR